MHIECNPTILWDIAAAHGISVNTLIAANSLLDPRLLRPGRLFGPRRRRPANASTRTVSTGKVRNRRKIPVLSRSSREGRLAIGPHVAGQREPGAGDCTINLVIRASSQLRPTPRTVRAAPGQPHRFRWCAVDRPVGPAGVVVRRTGERTGPTPNRYSVRSRSGGMRRRVKIRTGVTSWTPSTQRSASGSPQEVGIYIVADFAGP
jgi:hypothetical protein